jgi:putative salt-induced outer membrane protein YdiY
MTKADRRLAWITLLLCVGVATLCAQETREVTLQLKNGDRLTGRILSEDDQRVVLSTPWNVAIFVPKLEIQQQIAVLPPSSPASEEVTAMGATTNQAVPARPVEAPSGSATGAEPQPTQVAEAPLVPAKAPAAKEPSHWKWNLKLGADFISGAKDREIYFGQTALTYTRNYQRNPKEFLRNTLEYRVDYGRTDGQVSANRMLGANKLDFDVGKNWYGYASGGGGYDRVRKIDYQYEVGPGLGYHLIADKNVALDTELGFNYQYREGLNSAPDRELLQLRVGQDLTWQILPKITLSEQVAFLPFLEDPSQYQVRLEGNLGFGIVKYLSLNLTVLNFYDTQPAPGVPNNEFQFRSSLGVNF